MHVVLEQLSTFTPLGIRFWDPALDDQIRGGLQVYRLNKAQNLAEWQAAMALQAIPALNYIYADQAGNIGYVYNGMFPKREADIDWSSTLPGDRSELIWNAYLPPESTPQLWNPSSGLVFNANATPFHASEALDDNELTDNTLVLFCSDNRPAGGSAALRGVRPDSIRPTPTTARRCNKSRCDQTGSAWPDKKSRRW